MGTGGPDRDALYRGVVARGRSRSPLVVGLALTRTTATAATGLLDALRADLDRVGPALPDPDPTGPARGADVLVGALARAQDSMSRVRGAAAAVRTCAGAARMVTGHLLRVPPGPVLTRRVGRVLSDLAARGRVERRRAAALAGWVRQDGSAVHRFTQETTATVTRPLAATATPIVLDLLSEHPEQIRVLVREQSLGMGSELTGVLRVQAARGDDGVERLARRLLRRRPADQPRAE